jgi:hypothetical protein
MGSVEQYRTRYPLQVRPQALLQPTIPFAVRDNPRLRIRVASITVNEDYDESSNDVVYCVISTEAETTSELHLLPPTNALDEGDTQLRNYARDHLEGRQPGGLGLRVSSSWTHGLESWPIGPLQERAGGVQGGRRPATVGADP